MKEKEVLNPNSLLDIIENFAHVSNEKEYSFNEEKQTVDTKKFDAAIEFCQKLLEKNPNDPIALQNLSTAYYIVGAYNDTIKCCEKILEKDANEEHAVKNKMLALEKLELHDEVLRCCEILLSKNDKDNDCK